MKVRRTHQLYHREGLQTPSDLIAGGQPEHGINGYGAKDWQKEGSKTVTRVENV